MNHTKKKIDWIVISVIIIILGLNLSDLNGKNIQHKFLPRN